jgi:hypothetical protein
MAERSGGVVTASTENVTWIVYLWRNTHTFDYLDIHWRNYVVGGSGPVIQAPTIVHDDRWEPKPIN